MQPTSPYLPTGSVSSIGLPRSSSSIISRPSSPIPEMPIVNDLNNALYPDASKNLQTLMAKADAVEAKAKAAKAAKAKAAKAAKAAIAQAAIAQAVPITPRPADVLLYEGQGRSTIPYQKFLHHINENTFSYKSIPIKKEKNVRVKMIINTFTKNNPNTRFISYREDGIYYEITQEALERKVVRSLLYSKKYPEK